MRNILLGVTGSVAAIKTSKLAAALGEIGDVRIAPTEAGNYFIEQAGEPILCPFFRDSVEWPEKYKLGDPVVHIELRRWASALVIAPLDANTLAKLYHGLCDNLLTCVYRAWDWSRPVIIAPAMNTMMWDNHPTRMQIDALKNQKGITIVYPIQKRLACDDVGMGAMATIEMIARVVNDKLRWKFPLERCNGIPINHHPGAFGYHRRKNHHTGVDLYCKDNEPVFAVEAGTVVHIEKFTGPSVGHEWWEETWGVMVEGASGVINYGEVTPRQGLIIGSVVERGEQIANVKRVLFKEKLRDDIPGHSCSMLHFELYKHGIRDFADWHDVKKNPDLLDPTPYLMDAENRSCPHLTWDNPEAKTVG